MKAISTNQHKSRDLIKLNIIHATDWKNLTSNLRLLLTGTQLLPDCLISILCTGTWNDTLIWQILSLFFKIVLCTFPQEDGWISTDILSWWTLCLEDVWILTEILSWWWFSGWFSSLWILVVFFYGSWWLSEVLDCFWLFSMIFGSFQWFLVVFDGFWYCWGGFWCFDGLFCAHLSVIELFAKQQNNAVLSNCLYLYKHARIAYIPVFLLVLCQDFS